MSKHRSRRRQLERWLDQRKQQLRGHQTTLQEQLLPASWPVRCQRVLQLPEGSASRWQPRPGSSSAELSLLLVNMPFVQRQLLGSLLDAPSVGAVALVEAVERLQLGWRQRLDPLHSHREYAAQLETLAQLLELTPAARSAYLDNERQIVPTIDMRLFESLPPRLRADMANRCAPGKGHYLVWWQQQLLARAGVPGHELGKLDEQHWPDMPAAWFALGWICSLRIRDVWPPG